MSVVVDKIAATSRYDSLKNVYNYDFRYDVPTTIPVDWSGETIFTITAPVNEGTILSALVRSNTEGVNQDRWQNIRSPNRFFIDTNEDDGYEPKVYVWFVNTTSGVNVHFRGENFDIDPRTTVVPQWIDVKISIFAAPSS